MYSCLLIECMNFSSNYHDRITITMLNSYSCYMTYTRTSPLTIMSIFAKVGADHASLSLKLLTSLGESFSLRLYPQVYHEFFASRCQSNEFLLGSQTTFVVLINSKLYAQVFMITFQDYYIVCDVIIMSTKGCVGIKLKLIIMSRAFSIFICVTTICSLAFDKFSSKVRGWDVRFVDGVPLRRTNLAIYYV